MGNSEENVTVKTGQDEQAITFVHLSTAKQLADHEIIDRLFRSMTIQSVQAEIGWLGAKYNFPDRFIDFKELRRMIPVSPMTFRRWEAAGEFPRRVCLLGKEGRRRRVWRLSAVLEWMRQQEAV